MDGALWGEGSDELSIRLADTGRGVRLACSGGRLSVDEEAGEGAIELSTARLSEAVFGLLPLQSVLPELRPDSPLRGLFGLPWHVSHFFAL